MNKIQPEPDALLVPPYWSFISEWSWECKQSVSKICSHSTRQTMAYQWSLYRLWKESIKNTRPYRVDLLGEIGSRVGRLGLVYILPNFVAWWNNKEEQNTWAIGCQDFRERHLFGTLCSSTKSTRGTVKHKLPDKIYRGIVGNRKWMNEFWHTGDMLSHKGLWPVKAKELY